MLTVNDMRVGQLFIEDTFPEVWEVVRIEEDRVYAREIGVIERDGTSYGTAYYDGDDVGEDTLWYGMGGAYGLHLIDWTNQ